MRKITFKRKNRSLDQGGLEAMSFDHTSTNGSEDCLTLQKPESFDMNAFHTDELECLEKLSHFCFHANRYVPNDLIIRYAVYYNFNYTKAKEAISKGYTERYLYLEMEGELMRSFLRSKICFPLPGLRSRKTDSDVFYFRPSRYFPTSRNNRLLLDNLCCVLNDLSRTVEQCRNGVVMLVNMDGYSTKNFHNETQMKMTKIIEGDVIPTRFVEILIVNPPKVFKRLWKVVKPCFSSTYKKRIHIIKNEKLGNYLMDGYQDYLPDEFMGWRITEEMVTDWVDQKRYNDQQSCMF